MKKNIKILIVEDDLVSRRFLEKLLTNWGYEVLSAENGQEAWEILQKESPKIVIADWIMPVMDGVTLCRKIRTESISGYIYLIMLTCRDEKDYIVEGLAAGADDYVTKPFDHDELKVRIRAGERILNLEKNLNDKNMELQGLNRRLEELVRIDPLLEIGNRRSFYETIDKVHSRALRHEQGYGIIMCDIDHFKAYNDTHGHLAGDHILKTIADAVKNSLRSFDDIFRYGGEEIVILLPDQDIDKTAGIAERLRKDIESLGIEHKGSDTGILTISCGVAAFTKEETESRWEVVLDVADKALYKAKAFGRNRVCVSDK